MIITMIIIIIIVIAMAMIHHHHRNHHFVHLCAHAQLLLLPRKASYKKFKEKILSAKLKNNRKVQAYKIKCFILNTMSYGLPQNRERVYIIGVRQSAKGLKRATPKVFKPKRAMAKLTDFLRPLSAPSKKLSKAAKRNVKWAKKKLESQGVRLGDIDEAVVDSCAGKKFRQVTIDRCPTITRSRGSSRGFYLLKQGRFLAFNFEIISNYFYSFHPR